MTNICDSRRNGILKNWFIIAGSESVAIKGELDGSEVQSGPLLRVDFTEGIAVTKDATYVLSPKSFEGFMLGVV